MGSNVPPTIDPNDPIDSIEPLDPINSLPSPLNSGVLRGDVTNGSSALRGRLGGVNIRRIPLPRNCEGMVVTALRGTGLR